MQFSRNFTEWCLNSFHCVKLFESDDKLQLCVDKTMLQKILYVFCIFMNLIFISGAHARSARVLLLMALPGHLIFAYLIRLLNAGNTTLTVVFLIVYLTAALIQVSFSLFITYEITLELISLLLF